MNGDKNFRNGQDIGNVRNVKNFRNVRTDTKYHTFSEPQPRADLNDNGNFRNGGNVRKILECEEC